MRFLTFIKQSPEQKHPALISFAKFVHRQADRFPLSSNPVNLSLYLYNKLNEEQTKGFQVFMMAYRNEKNNMLPKELIEDDQQFLEAINLIIHYQHNDPLKNP